VNDERSLSWACSPVNPHLVRALFIGPDPDLLGMSAHHSAERDRIERLFDEVVEARCRRSPRFSWSAVEGLFDGPHGIS
jgi:hypothetical protein